MNFMKGFIIGALAGLVVGLTAMLLRVPSPWGQLAGGASVVLALGWVLDRGGRRSD